MHEGPLKRPCIVRLSPILNFGSRLILRGLLLLFQEQYQPDDYQDGADDGASDLHGTKAARILPNSQDIGSRKQYKHDEPDHK